MLTVIERERALDARLAHLSKTLEELKAIDVGRVALPDAARANEFNALFERGDWAGVAREFEAQPSLQSSEHALFRAAVAYALPSNPRHDPTRARQLFGLLMNRYPDTVYRGDVDWARVAMAKNVASDLALEVADEAVQLHGGYGYMREFVVERLLRDLRLFPIGGGTREVMKEIIAKQLGL